MRTTHPIKIILLLAASALVFTGYSVAVNATSLPAFPGAEGFGSTTIGGRGGQVVKVTNLNDSGSGSFRAAAEEMTVPRIVVFDVAGVIELSNEITIEDPYITIASQTAPGNGITLKNAGIRVKTHDVIIRGLHIRPGDSTVGEDPETRDGVVVGARWGVDELTSYNVIIDHNSISWGVDENVLNLGEWE